MNQILKKIINSGDVSWEELFYISLGEDIAAKNEYDEGYKNALVEAAPTVDEAIKRAYEMGYAAEFEKLPSTPAYTVDLSKTKRSKQLTEKELMEAIKTKSGSLNLVLGLVSNIEESSLDPNESDLGDEDETRSKSVPTSKKKRRKSKLNTNTKSSGTTPKKLIKYLQSTGAEETPDSNFEEYEKTQMPSPTPEEQRTLEKLEKSREKDFKRKPTARKLIFSPKKQFKATLRPDSPYKEFVPFELEYDKHNELIKALKEMIRNENYRYVKDLTVGKIKEVPNRRDKTIRVELHKAFYPNKKGGGKSKNLKVESLGKFANLKIVNL